MAVKDFETYLSKHPSWEPELRELRSLLLAMELEETIKWGAPTYTLMGKNVLSLVAFKNHCALWFFNGALLKENTALLENAQDGKTRAMRQIRFQKGKILPAGRLKAYIREAIKNQQEGKSIKPQRDKPLILPNLLRNTLESDPDLKADFEKLSKGKQREFAGHIAGAKRETTKSSRLNKILPLIRAGKGLHDHYRH